MKFVAQATDLRVHRLDVDCFVAISMLMADALQMFKTEINVHTVDTM